jgi:hypothetical protein
MGKNKAPGVFDHAEFRGLFVIVLFCHATQTSGGEAFHLFKTRSYRVPVLVCLF